MCGAREKRLRKRREQRLVRIRQRDVTRWERVLSMETLAEICAAKRNPESPFTKVKLSNYAQEEVYVKSLL